MSFTSRVFGFVTASIALMLSVGFFAFAQQGNQKKDTAAPPGTPALWQEPSDIASRNLYLGPGGEAMKPTLSKVTFIEEKESAGAAKFRVRDGSGRERMVKAGGEAQAEVAASRIVWAVGYYTHKDRLAGITVEQAKWIGALLARLSNQQLPGCLPRRQLRP